MQWIELLLLVLASFRLTHLIVYDTIMEPLRVFTEKSLFVHELVTCYWCCGIWTSALLLLLQDQWPRFASPLILMLAVAAGQALVEAWVQRK
jgi:hypothetical protein